MAENNNANEWHNTPDSKSSPTAAAKNTEPDAAAQASTQPPAQTAVQAATASQSKPWVWLVVALIVAATLLASVFLLTRTDDTSADVAAPDAPEATAEAASAVETTSTTASASGAKASTTTVTVTETSTTTAGSSGPRQYNNIEAIAPTEDYVADALYINFLHVYADTKDPNFTLYGIYSNTVEGCDDFTCRDQGDEVICEGTQGDKVRLW